MTVEEMRVFYLDLNAKVRATIARFIGNPINADMQSGLVAAIHQTIEQALVEAQLDGLTLAFDLTFSAEAGNPVVVFHPGGRLRDVFVEAFLWQTSPVDPDKKAVLRNFNPLWGSDDPVEFEHTEGVPPVEQNDPRWGQGYDPIWKE
jgi:hypothetical protein